MVSPYAIINYSLPIYMSEDKLWRHVDIDSDGCWLYNRSQSANGYGALWSPEKQQTKGAHQVAFKVANDVWLEPDEEVCHRCDKPLCIKPSCLFRGNSLLNKQDAISKDRHARGERIYNHSITDAKASEIRRLYRETNYKQSEIAAMLGVSKNIVYKVIHNLAWSHVND